MESVFILCYGFPVALMLLFHIVRLLVNTSSEDEDEAQKPLQIDLTPFWDAFNNTFAGTKYGGFSKYQQPISDEKTKNDDDEVFDEKRKRLEEDEDESYWVVGDDGELVEKSKR